MDRSPAPPRLTFETRTRRWARSLLLGSAAVLVLAAAFFFLTIAIVVGTMVAAVIALRFWWRMRRLRNARPADTTLEGEFTVVEHEVAQPSKRVRDS